MSWQNYHAGQTMKNARAIWKIVEEHLEEIQELSIVMLWMAEVLLNLKMTQPFKDKTWFARRDRKYPKRLINSRTD